MNDMNGKIFLWRVVGTINSRIACDSLFIRSPLVVTLTYEELAQPQVYEWVPWAWGSRGAALWRFNDREHPVSSLRRALSHTPLFSPLIWPVQDVSFIGSGSYQSDQDSASTDILQTKYHLLETSLFNGEYLET